MDLSFLIPSKIRRLVLAYFVENPKAQVGVRELARELSVSPQQTYRELVNLEGWGFLFSSRRGNQRAFRVNVRFVLTESIQTLFKRYQTENHRTYSVRGTARLKDIVKELSRIPVPSYLVSGLISKRVMPRAYDEEKLLKKYADRSD